MVLVNLVVIRILAVALIVNSHLDIFYPLSQLAIGGRLGNSLFYFISGVGLSISFQRNPVPALEWARKRGIKLIVPLLMYIGVVSIGNLQAFTDAVLNNMVWHKPDQLERFLPVLLGLYLLFLQINNLSIKRTKHILIVLVIISAALLIHRVYTIDNVPAGLPTSDIFFTLNALICFVLGIFLTKEKEFEVLINRKKKFYIICSFILIFVSQGLHQYVKYLGGNYIVLDFYINFVTVISLFIFLSLIDFSKIKSYTPLLYDIASSSLAVFIVHFKVIKVVNGANISFPYNIISVYLYSFIFAYALTKLSVSFSNYILDKIVLRK